MRKLFFLCLLVGLVVTSCASQPLATTESSKPLPTINTTQEPEGINSPDCLGSVISPIGQSIAEDFESVDYQQVIFWFCNGAEFEDILVALETELQTDTSAEDMLQMLADGMDWDEIWQYVGLTD